MIPWGCEPVTEARSVEVATEATLPSRISLQRTQADDLCLGLLIHSLILVFRRLNAGTEILAAKIERQIESGDEVAAAADAAYLTGLCEIPEHVVDGFGIMSRPGVGELLLELCRCDLVVLFPREQAHDVSKNSAAANRCRRRAERLKALDVLRALIGRNESEKRSDSVAEISRALVQRAQRFPDLIRFPLDALIVNQGRFESGLVWIGSGLPG